MKNLNFVAVVGKQERQIMSGSRKGQYRTILTVQTSDGNVVFLNEEYISRKLDLVGASLTEFKQNPANFVLNISTDQDGNLGEILLRKEGEAFEYVDADGKKQITEANTTYYDVRGSFTFTYSDAGNMQKSVANILANAMAKQMGINLNEVTSTPTAPVVEQEVANFTIDENEQVD